MADLRTHFRAILPNVVTLPQYFRASGYLTSGFSKVYHDYLDDSRSWLVPSWFPDGPAWGSAENAARAEALDQALRSVNWIYRELLYPSWVYGSSWSALDQPDADMPDAKTATTLIQAMYAWRNQPFFLAAGFLKPHLPFAVPRKYFDLYPPSKVSLMPQDFQAAPRDMPSDAGHSSPELRTYSDIPESEPISASKALELVRGYYASVSFLDAQIGRVMAALDYLGIREQTIVVLTSDHGYHLGDHGLWAKHSNFEKATRVPLIVSAPGQANAGRASSALVESVDLYPTLCELAGLPVPAGLEGTSFAPVIAQPERNWKKAVFSQYRRKVEEVDTTAGYSVRTQRFRLTEWRAAAFGTLPTASVPPGSTFRGLELYDYQADPHESVNLAAHPAYSTVVNALLPLLRGGWRYAGP